jgi:small subunit ribosomal protein S1
MSESFEALFNESIKHTEMTPGELVTGTVLEVTEDYVLVNAGLKTEAMIPVEEFKSRNGELSVAEGDQIEVELERVADGHGETILSREKARRQQAWKDLEVAMEKRDTIYGVINGKVKGGFTVEMDDVKAFLPGSLVDVRPVRDIAYLENKELEFKVIKIDRERNNVVLSRKAVLEEEFSEERRELLDSLEEGKVITGIVKNLTDYGAFIDLGGIDGLLHITDIAWKRVNHPSEALAIGDEVEVKVLSFDKERSRVSLGMKQLGEDPWLNILRRYPPSSRVFGKITNIADYGAFVEIEEGIEGLVHTSEMDWTNKNIHPSKVVALGEDVEVMVLDIDEERRRISLGMKHCTANPWELFAATHQKGEKISGKIRSITDFGIFVGLDGNIDGLVHLSDLSWNESGEKASRNYRKGQEVEAYILGIDSERERISLGIKQLNQDPFSIFATENPKGSVVKGTVSAIMGNKVIVDLGKEVQGSIKISDLSRERINDISDVLNEGDEVEALITGLDRKSRAIALSIKEKDIQEEKQAIANYSGSAATETTTLGDLIKEQMEEKS